jgi:hypothetical protein
MGGVAMQLSGLKVAYMIMVGKNSARSQNPEPTSNQGSNGTPESPIWPQYTQIFTEFHTKPGDTWH